MSLTSALKSLFAKGPDRTISFEDLNRNVGAGTVCVVDVREPSEFASSHVPGAINRPLSAFNPGELPTNKPVVLICQAGGRSARALGTAVAAGRSDVVHYAGGMNGWKRSGGRID